MVTTCNLFINCNLGKLVFHIAALILFFNYKIIYNNGKLTGNIQVCVDIYIIIFKKDPAIQPVYILISNILPVN
jgi:hypothetical protein